MSIKRLTKENRKEGGHGTTYETIAVDELSHFSDKEWETFTQELIKIKVMKTRYGATI